MVRRRNLFISHSWNYKDHYERLVAMLRDRSYFEFNNHSVPKDDPIHDADNDSELYDAIKDKMQGCHAVLIMAGVYSSYSKWIKKEIKIAQEEFDNAKPIIAVAPWGAEYTSQIVKDSADEIVRWNTNSIVKAIRKRT